MERSELNWRGVVVFGLAVLTVIVLIRVIDDDPASLGVNTAGSTSQDDGGDTAATTTLPSGVTTTRPAGGSTTTTAPAINPAGKPNLQTGSQGADVMLVQQRLTTLGYYSGPIDGQYGQGTANAVSAFQTAKGLPADGAVGPATWQALATG